MPVDKFDRMRNSEGTALTVVSMAYANNKVLRRDDINTANGLINRIH